MPIESPSTSRPRSNRVKFLCSHGGNILPRPDGLLKYVGGETRVISIHRDITFPEFMKKLTSMFNGEMIVKYQLMPDDLEVLVTVKSDEDIRHMIDECDRHEHQGAPRLRAFLFPASAVVMVNNNNLRPLDRHSQEQQYINYIVSSPTTPPETTTSSLTRNHSSPSLTRTHHHHHQPPLDRHKSSGPEHVGRMRSTGVIEYYKQQMDHSHRGGHMDYQRGSSYDDYCGDGMYDRADSPPSPDGPSSSRRIRSGR